MLTINMTKRLLARSRLPKADEYETKELEVLVKLYVSLYDELTRVEKMIFKLESPK